MAARARSLAYQLTMRFAMRHDLQTEFAWPFGSELMWRQELTRLQAIVQVRALQTQLGERLTDRTQFRTFTELQTQIRRLQRQIAIIVSQQAFDVREAARVAEQARQDAQIQATRDRHRNLINLLDSTETVHPNGVIDFKHTFNPAINSTDFNLVEEFVRHILRRRNPNDGFIIKLMGVTDVTRNGVRQLGVDKLLNSQGVILVSNKQQAINFLIAKIAAWTVGGRYDFDIGMVVVRIIPANGGGCNNNKHDKTLVLGSFKLKSKVVKNNNCYFASIKKYIGLTRVTKKPCNAMRDRLQLEHDGKITVGQAIELFKLCRTNDLHQLRIIDNDTGTTKQTEDFNDVQPRNEKERLLKNQIDAVTLFLMDGHYWLVVGEDKICSICGNKWKIKHKCRSETTAKCKLCGHFHPSKKTCNPKHVTYYQMKILKSKNRYVLGCTKEEELDNRSVVHYDLETHPRVNKTHQPYIVGYCFPTFLDQVETSKFDFIAGKDCCEQYVKKLVEYASQQYNLIEVTSERELKIAKIKCGIIPKQITEKMEITEAKDYTHGVEKKEEPLENMMKHRYVRKLMTDKIYKKYIEGVDYDVGEKPPLDAERTYYKYFKKVKRNVYLNAFNGANFDHYFLLKVFMKMGYEVKDFVLKGGSIFRAKFENIIFMDIRKHTTGSFKENLETMGCNLAKGDFDHAKGDDWEKMSEKDRKDCLAYLKIDVMGLKELYEKMNEALYGQFKVNMHSFFSTSHTTFTMWRRHLNNESPTLIKIPSLKEESAFRPACFGGRCYPSKKAFESCERDPYLKGKLDYDKVNDYLVDLDVVSLYPSVMQLYEYPVGEVLQLEKAELDEYNRVIREDRHCKEVGIYYIKYKPNKHLAHAILPHRTPLGLKWTLADGEGYFTSIDIDNALNYGYEVVILDPNEEAKYERIVYHKKCGKKHIDEDYWAEEKHSRHKCQYCTLQEDKDVFFTTDDECIGVKSIEDIKKPIGFYWLRTKKIYKTYIEELFKKKKAAKRGSPERALAKLFMNGLYGKMIQRPIADKTIWAKSLSDFWKFYKNHKIEDIEIINGQMYLTGRSRDEAENEKCINKPTQLGAFILGYTRRLMLKYYNQSNPYFDISEHKDKPDFADYKKLQVKNDFYYTDTDAIQVHHDNLMPLSKDLGGIDDDLQEYAPDGGSTKIMRGIWIAPKLYMLEFITSDSSNPMTEKDKKLVAKGQCDIRIMGGKKVYFTYRGKGVPTDKLNVEAFEKMKAGGTFSTQRDFQMKKNNVKLNKPQVEAGVEYFSITHHVGKETERVLNRRPWNGRLWTTGGSTPIV